MNQPIDPKDIFMQQKVGPPCQPQEEITQPLSETCDHEWVNSRDFLGLVGNLYYSINPWACRKGCGSLRGADLTVKEGQRTTPFIKGE